MDQVAQRVFVVRFSAAAFWKTGSRSCACARPGRRSQAGTTAGTEYASPKRPSHRRAAAYRAAGSRRTRRRIRWARQGSGSCRTARAYQPGRFQLPPARRRTTRRQGPGPGRRGRRTAAPRPRAEHVVSGQQADAKRCGAHEHQGRDQGFLTAEVVTEVAEQQAAERAGQKAHRKGDEGEQRGEHRVGLSAAVKKMRPK